MESEIRSIALAFYEANGTPVALGCYLQLKYGELRDLMSRKLDPRAYCSSQSDKFFRDYASVNFLKKYNGVVPGLDPVRKAEEAFLACERKCAATNVVMRDFLSFMDNDGVAYPENLPYYRYLLKVRQKVGEVLGPLPRDLEPRFGPGATLSDSGRECSVVEKISSTPTCTEAGWLLIDPLWRDKYRSVFSANSESQLPRFVRGNRFTTVPKTAVTDRPICIEPSLLMYYQKGVGAAIRNRLRRVGIRLDRAQEVHRSMLTHRQDDFSTIDLSSASDTVSHLLVKALLPTDWYLTLVSLRSPLTFFRGKWHRLEKFSSMGNGFTFELESLLFLCIISALDEASLVPGKSLFVYGDDIMLPPSHFEAACGALSFCGFELNESKSFKEGPFKESCGVDVFSGINVRSFYLKDPPNDPSRFFTLLNGIRHLANRYAGDYRKFDLYRRPWLRALDCVPSHLRRLRGPIWLGDLVIYDEDAMPSVSRQTGCEHWKVLQPEPRRISLKRFRPQAVFASALYGVTVGQGSIVTRGTPRGYRVRTVGQSA